jgi:hypothetical protein
MAIRRRIGRLSLPPLEHQLTHSGSAARAHNTPHPNQPQGDPTSTPRPTLKPQYSAPPSAPGAATPLQKPQPLTPSRSSSPPSRGRRPSPASPHHHQPNEATAAAGKPPRWPEPQPSTPGGGKKQSTIRAQGCGVSRTRIALAPGDTLPRRRRGLMAGIRIGGDGQDMALAAAAPRNRDPIRADRRGDAQAPRSVSHLLLHSLLGVLKAALGLGPECP